MFYTEAVLTKQGPLARIWLAAHWDKKLTKAVVFDTDLETACESVVNPSVKLALRTSGHLLLGVVRIYNRKAKYLLADCNDAFVKIKLAFRAGQSTINLPENSKAIEGTTTTRSTTKNNQIFLPSEDFDLAPMKEVSATELKRAMLKNTARIEEITIKHKSSSLQHGNIFKDLMREAEYEHAGGFGDTSEWADSSKNLTEAELEKQRRSAIEKQAEIEQDIDIMHELENVDADVNELDLFLDDPQDMADAMGPSKSAVEQAPPSVDNLEKTVPQNFSEISKINAEHDDMEDDRPPSPIDMEPGTPFQAPQTPAGDAGPGPIPPGSPMGPPMSPMHPSISVPQSPAHSLPPQSPLSVRGQMLPPQSPNVTTVGDLHQSNQIILSPLDPVQVRDMQNERKRAPARKKRSLLVDSSMEITNNQMKAQLKDYSDIVLHIAENYDWLAPPTIRLLQWKDKGTVDPLFKDAFVGNQCLEKSKWLNSLSYAGGNTSFAPKERRGRRRQDSRNSTIEQPRHSVLENNTIVEGGTELSSIQQNVTEQDVAKLAGNNNVEAEVNPIEDAANKLSEINVSKNNEAEIDDEGDNLEPKSKRSKLDPIAEDEVMQELPPNQTLQRTLEPNFSANLTEDQVQNQPGNSTAIGGGLEPEPGLEASAIQPANAETQNDVVDPSISINPASVAQPALSPAAPIDPAEMFAHIDLRKIDDDKKRDICMLDMIDANMEATRNETLEPEASFVTLSTGQDRKRAARQFYSLLVLRKQKIIEVVQEGHCEDISIRKNVNFAQGRKLVKI